MAKIFKPRRGKKSTMAGTKKTTVLSAGEMFIEVPDTGAGTGHSKMKIGDGSTQYSSLPYAMGDTENDKIAFSNDTSGNITTALNKVTSGAALKTMIAALKQAVSLANTSITQLNDDIQNLEESMGTDISDKLDQILEMLLTKTQWVNNGLRSYNIDVTISAGQEIGLECIENVIAIPKQGLKSISFKASGIIERGDLFDMSNFKHYPRTFIGSVDNYDVISNPGVYFGNTGVDGEEWSVHDVTTKNQTTLTYNNFSNYRDIIVFGTIGNLKIASGQTKCCTYDIEILYS